MRAALALCLACALLASGRAQPAPGACPGLLTLVRQMPDSGLFADVLEALGATGEQQARGWAAAAYRTRRSAAALHALPQMPL